MVAVTTINLELLFVHLSSFIHLGFYYWFENLYAGMGKDMCCNIEIEIKFEMQHMINTLSKALRYTTVEGWARRERKVSLVSQTYTTRECLAAYNANIC